MSTVTPEIVSQVAELARIRLKGETLAEMAEQLDKILAYVQKLSAVSTEGVEPTSHVLPLTNVLRADRGAPSLPAQAVLDLAPAKYRQWVSVPKVIGS